MYTVYECSIWYAAYKDKERFWKLRPLPVDLDDWYDMAWNKLIRMGLPIPPLPPHLSMLRNEGKAVQGRIDEHVTSGRLGLSVASWMFAYFTPVVNPPPLAPWSAASRWPVRGPPGNGDLWSVGSTRETRSLEAPSFHRTCMLRRMWCHNLRFWDTENRGWDRKNKINRSTDINELRLWRDSSWNCLSHERASPPKKKGKHLWRISMCLFQPRWHTTNGRWWTNASCLSALTSIEMDVLGRKSHRYVSVTILEPLQATDVRTICHLHTNNNQEIKKTKRW